MSRKWVSIGPAASLNGQAANNPIVSGRVTGLALSRDGRRAYAATAGGGVWRSDDAGDSWRPLMDELRLSPQYPEFVHLDFAGPEQGASALACGAVACVTDDPDRVFVGTGEYATDNRGYRGVGILASNDGGRTWVTENIAAGQDTLDGAIVFALTIDPGDSNRVMAATSRGLYRRTSDGSGGFQWEQRRIHTAGAGGDGLREHTTSVAAARAGDTTTWFIAQRGGDVYRSQNHGSTWQPAATGLAVNAGDILSLAVKHDDAGLLYVLVSTGQLLRADLGVAAPAWQAIGGFPATVNGSFGGAEGEIHQAITVDPTARNRVFFGGGRSHNRSGGAAAWTAALYRADIGLVGGSPQMAPVNIGRAVPPYVNAVEFPIGAPTALWVGGDSGIFTTDQPAGAGEIFASRSAGLIAQRMTSLALHPAHESVLLGGTEGNGCIRYIGGEIWDAAYKADTRYHRDCAVHLGDVQAAAINWHDPYQILIAAAPSSNKVHTTSATPKSVALFVKRSDGGDNPDPPETAEIVMALDAGDTVESYSPLVANPHVTGNVIEANRVAFGSRQLWVSDDFGSNWGKAGAALPSHVRSIAFASFNRIYAGCMEGQLYRFDHAAGTWTATRLDTQPGLPAGVGKISQPITSLAVDPGNPNRLYLTFGGRGVYDRLWFYDGAAWSSRHNPAAPAIRQLPQVQALAVAIDPTTPANLYVGTDIGVWHSTDSGANWDPFNEGLPEIPVHQLLAHGPQRLLRAATRGRGVYELHLDDDTPDVKLFVRDHRLDVGLRTNYGLPLDDPTDNNAAPGARRQITDTDSQSPDIKADAPDVNIHYQIADDACIDFHTFESVLTDESATVAIDPTNVKTRLYVQVHNRGVNWAHKVRVMLLVSRIDGGNLPDLPNDYQLNLQRGSEINADGWKTVGQATLDDVRAGVPGIARFELPSEMLAEFGPLSAGDQFMLLCLTHHPDDPFEAGERTVATLARDESKATLRKVTTADLHPAPAAPPATVPNRWKPIGPTGVRRGQLPTQSLVSGRVPDIAIAPGGMRIYIATANAGVWRSDDKGITWRSLMAQSFDENPANVAGHWNTNGLHSLAIGAIALDPTNPDRLYVGTGEAHHGYMGVGPTLTADGGRTWAHPEPTSANLIGQGFYGLAVDPGNPDFVVAATTRGVFRRQPAAHAPGPFRWVRKAFPGGVIIPWDRATHVVVARSGGRTRFFAARMHDHGVGAATDLRGYIFFSADGDHWDEIPNFPRKDGLQRITLAVKPNNRNMVYALDNKGRVHRAERTTGVWSAWVKIENIPGDFPNKQGWYNQAIAVSPNDLSTIVIGGQSYHEWPWSVGAGAVYRLRIQGKRVVRSNFIGNSLHPDVHKLIYPPNNHRELWCGCDGGIYYAADADATGDHVFVDRNTGIQSLELNAIDRHPTTENVLFAGTQDNGGIRYTGDETWLHVTPGDGGYPVVNQTDPHRYIVTYTEHIMRGADHGGVWGWALFGGDMVKTVDGIDHDQPLFYAPLVRCLRGNDNLLAFGTRALWISGNFGRDWQSIPDSNDNDRLGPALPGDSNKFNRQQWAIRSILFVRPNLIYVGLMNGRVYRYTHAGGTWSKTQIDNSTTTGTVPPDFDNFSRQSFPVRSIVLDPADANGTSIFVALGGSARWVSHVTGFGHIIGRVWHYNGGTGEWSDRSGTGATRIPNSQANALIVDPNNNNHMYVGMDIGVWRTQNVQNAVPNWVSFWTDLPDTAVLDFKWHDGGARGVQLLRAATYGFGAWEHVIGPANVPRVELFLRNSSVDGAREGVVPLYGNNHRDPNSRSKKTTFFGGSPDVKIDAPNDDGEFQFANDDEPTYVEYVDKLSDNSKHVAVAEQPIVNRIYIQVHNRGSIVGKKVTVQVLLGSDPPADLPANYLTTLQNSNPLNTDAWSTVGEKTIDKVQVGRPQIVRFDLPPALLPRWSELASPARRGLLVLAYQKTGDTFLGNERNVAQLCNSHRQATFKSLKIERYSGRIPRSDSSLPPFVPNLLPVSVALLTRKKISDLRDALQAKIDTAGADISPTERRIHAMADRAAAMFNQGDAVDAPANAPLPLRFSKFALLGSTAWSLPDYIDLLSPQMGWITDVLRRGTPDAHFSKAIVPTSQFVVRAGELAMAQASSSTEKEKIQAFIMGLMCALAAEVTGNPILRGLQAERSSIDWDHRRVGIDDILTNRWISRELLKDAPSQSRWRDWFPDSSSIPDALFNGFAEAIREAYDPNAARRERFADSQTGAVDKYTVSGGDLKEGYDLFFKSMSPGAHWAIWWLLLSPIILMGPLSLIMARYAMPNAKRLLANVTDDAGQPLDADESSWYELYQISMALGGVMPFIYAMILWGIVPRQNPYFVQALVFGFVRAAVSAGALATTDEGPELRWGLFFTLHTSFDLYFLVRSITEWAQDHPGHANMYMLQWLPLLTAGSSFLFALLSQLTGWKEDWQFWLMWAIYTAGLWFGLGMPLGAVISNSGGLVGLLKNRRLDNPEILDFLDPAVVPPMSHTRARAFDRQVLWEQDGTALEHRRYPSGTRAVVKIWWIGDGDMTVKHDRDQIVFSDGTVETPVALDGPLTPQEIADQLKAGLAGIEAAPFDADDPAYALPAPQMLADPGDTALTWAAHDAAREQFQPVGKSQDQAYLLRHSPRSELTTPVGIGETCNGSEKVRLHPRSAADPFDGTGIDLAADLAAMLCLGATPSVNGADITVAGLATDNKLAKVHQVFRQWNLDERRVNEWKMLIAGGAQSEKGSHPERADSGMRPAPDDYVSRAPEGEPIATNLGWLNAFKAWKAIGADTQADGTIDRAHSASPTLRLAGQQPRQATARELTNAMRFLFDLP